MLPEIDPRAALPPMTLKQEQDDYLKEIQIYTAIFKSVGLSPQ